MLITGEGRTVSFRPEANNGCQATSIHLLLVQKCNLHTHHLPTLIAMSNANGSPNRQRVAMHVAQIHLHFPKYDHEEYLEVLVLELGLNQMLFGIDWPNFHNPEVDWSMPSLQFMHCPKRCSTNASQLTIRWTAKAEKQPTALPKPEIDENGLSKGLKPNYIKPFQHLFEKKNFDKLPICHEWDHEINLTEDELASIPARLYRMTPVEQEAINQFVEEELFFFFGIEIAVYSKYLYVIHVVIQETPLGRMYEKRKMSMYPNVNHSSCAVFVFIGRKEKPKHISQAMRQENHRGSKMSIGSSANVKADGFFCKYLKIAEMLLSALLKAMSKENLEVYLGHSVRRCE